MTVLNRTPENVNFLQPTKYLLTFDRIPTAQYFCQEVNIPGISLNHITVPSPALDYHVAGNKLNYNMFNMKFMVDEKMQSWKNIYYWLMSIASPKGTDERNRLTDLQNDYKQTTFKQYSDAIVTVLSNTNNTVARIQLTGMFPVSLSDIQFDTTLSADHIITADATFSVKYIEFLDV